MRRLPLLLAAFLALPALAGKPPEKSGDKSGEKVDKKARDVQRQLVLAQFALVGEHDPKAAAAALKKALQIDPMNWKAAIQLVDVHVQLGEAKQALQLLDRFAKKNPGDAAVWHAIGAVKLKSNDEAGAMEALKKAVALDARDPEAQFALFRHAYLKLQGGDATVKAEAIQAGRAFLRASAFNRGLQYQLVERAVLELDGTPLDLTLYDAKLAYERAFAETRIGRINDAMGAARRGFEKCLEAQPDNQTCHFYLGRIYSSVKASEGYDLRKAAAELAAAKDIADAQVELGILLRRSDDTAGAERAFKRALELAPSSARALLEMGILAKLDGRTDEAVDLFARAVHSDLRSAAGARALDELVKLRPDHELARLGLMTGGPAPQDIFSSERFLAAVSLIEQKFGGVEENAPETPALREMIARLLRAADQSPSKMPRVAVLSTTTVENAMALPNGNVYVTRALLDKFKQWWPDRPLDANHGPLGHVFAHELAHVLRQHAAQSLLYVEAVRDASARLDPSILTHTTRLQEIEADRMGMTIAFLAGYGPLGGIEFLTKEGKETEIPAHLDHPTFDERVHYLEEYWSNDVKYAFQAWRSGVEKMDKAGAVEAQDTGAALQLYKDALDDLRRFRDTVTGGREVLSNMGVAYAKLGVLSTARDAGALTLWQTPFSIERETAKKYKSLADGASRGGGAPGGGPEVPWQLAQAIELFKEALTKDPSYRPAAINLATAEIAAGAPGEALAVLGKLPAQAGAAAAEAQNLVGVAQALAGKGGEAERALKAALAAQPDAPAPAFNLARLYRTLGKKSDADAAFKAYAAKFPTGAWADAARRELPAPAAK